MKSSCSYRYLDMFLKVTEEQEEDYTCDNISFEITGVKIKGERSSNVC